MKRLHLPQLADQPVLFHIRLNIYCLTPNFETQDSYFEVDLQIKSDLVTRLRIL